MGIVAAVALVINLLPPDRLPARSGAFAAAVEPAARQDRIPRTPTLPGVSDAPFPYARPDALGLDPDRVASLGEMVRHWIATDSVVGAEILVVKDRTIVLHEALGWSDLEAGVPMRRNSLFRLRSMTKPFTGTASLILVEEGRLALDAPVSRYLPSWDNERSGTITVEQLLAHRSGFVQGGTPEPSSAYASLRAVVDACGEQGPQETPGDRFMYSDVNSFTLGAVIAEGAGMPVETFIRSRILDRVGLGDVHIGYSPDAPWAVRMNPTYNRVAGRWFKYWTPARSDVFPYFRASGGILSTALDYARWLAFWMDGTRLPQAAGGGRLLSEETVRRATRRPREGQVAGYGLHWEVFRDEPLIFGHGGSDGTIAMAVPSEDLLLLYFTQSRGGRTLRAWADAAQHLLSGGG